MASFHISFVINISSFTPGSIEMITNFHDAVLTSKWHTIIVAFESFPFCSIRSKSEFSIQRLSPRLDSRQLLIILKKQSPRSRSLSSWYSLCNEFIIINVEQASSRPSILSRWKWILVLWVYSLLLILKLERHKHKINAGRFIEQQRKEITKQVIRKKLKRWKWNKRNCWWSFNPYLPYLTVRRKQNSPNIREWDSKVKLNLYWVSFQCENWTFISSLIMDTL